MKYAALFFLVILISGCKEADESSGMTPLVSSSPNILLIIADDMGKDATPGYPEGDIKPGTPNLDAVRASGLTFNNLWVYPTCSPTRASVITGKYGYSTGVKWAADVLSNSETILHSYINSQTNNRYATALIGKWHLAGRNNSFNPESLGMDYYAGLIAGTADNYTEWNFTEDGVSTTETSYITEKLTDLSADWISTQTKPWFLWLAYTAPHTPFHLPPDGMHSQTGLAEYTEGTDPIPYYLAAIEAMDYQIGKLLESLPDDERENTVIIFIGDNGTSGQAAQNPYRRGKVKGSLFQGGINTPMFISGPGVSRLGTDDNLITSTDLFATIAEIAGASGNDIYDSKSFKALLSSNTKIRNFQYCEMDDGTTDAWTISDGQYKVIINTQGEEQMYDLLDDPYENTNLLSGSLSVEASAAKSALETELNIIRE